MGLINLVFRRIGFAIQKGLAAQAFYWSVNNESNIMLINCVW